MLGIDCNANASCMSALTDSNKILTELAQRNEIGLGKIIIRGS